MSSAPDCDVASMAVTKEHVDWKREFAEWLGGFGSYTTPTETIQFRLNGYFFHLSCLKETEKPEMIFYIFEPFWLKIFLAKMSTLYNILILCYDALFAVECSKVKIDGMGKLRYI